MFLMSSSEIILEIILLKEGNAKVLIALVFQRPDTILVIFKKKLESLF